ncbi:phage tail protein, partial [Streptomyces sp. NPDC051546]|uniref:phage tail protein n=1 Tax=Streptomyces sp. NPDC051546 TaxID=3365655 RepID=UPI0037B394BD
DARGSTIRPSAGNPHKKLHSTPTVSLDLKSSVFAWLFTVSENKVEKTDCTITLTNESGSELLITWTITDAFPVALAGQNLEGTDGEGSIEEVTLLAKRVSVKFH